MEEKSYLNLDSSILYRSSQKFFEKALKAYDLGLTSMLILINIYEKEGCNLNELIKLTAIDKGAMSKIISKLESQGYITLETSKDDKRSKLINSTFKARELMPTLYKVKKQWVDYITSDLKPEEIEQYCNISSKLVAKARDSFTSNEDDDSLHFYGLQKLTLLDYPGVVSCTLFTGGCNFRCPFCHNSGLVFLDESVAEISKEEIIDYLSRRKGILDGVCISGGEPTLYSGLKDFIIMLKELGYKVKLDTNGSNYELLKELIDEKLVDYVAMDIKNSKEKYNLTIGRDDYDLSNIEKSIDYLLKDYVDYEFRTTVVSPFHDLKDIENIAKRIKGAKRYFLQNFEDHGTCIKKDYCEEVSGDTLKQMRINCLPYIKQVEIRGKED